MFIGPCVIIYSYSTTNKMHLFLQLFILVTRSACFRRSLCPSSGDQNCTYSNRHMCSFELLMMDRMAVRNMQSSKLHIWQQAYVQFELLMMDGKTVQNTQSSKLHIRQQAYVQFWAPDDGQKDHAKHAERVTRISNWRNRCILLVVL